METKGELIIRGLNENEFQLFTENINPEGIEVHRKLIKSSGLDEILEITFSDFSTIAFIRDIVLVKVLSMSLGILKGAIKYLEKENNRTVDVACFEFSIDYAGNIVNFNIVCHPSELDEIIENIDKIITESFLSELKNRDTVMIRFDHKKNGWEVAIM